MQKRKLMASLLAMALLAISAAPGLTHAQSLSFSGSTAYADVLKQMSLGPRIPGSPALLSTAAYIRSNLTSVGWQVTFQNFTYQNALLRSNVAAQNVIVTLPPIDANGSPLRIVLGAHYDTRPLADNPSSPTNLPVPGANDGASGVAVLLELGRVLRTDGWGGGLTMVFFDGEDSGLYSGAGWIQGSEFYVQSLKTSERSQIQAVIVVDMVGYSDLILKREARSDFAINNAIWNEGNALGYSQFANGNQEEIIDDHTPFLDARIRAVDLIDFSYPYWHTPYDTADKVSPSSLEAVGRTVEAFILSNQIPGPIIPAGLLIVLGGLVASGCVAILLLVRSRSPKVNESH